MSRALIASLAAFSIWIAPAAKAQNAAPPPVANEAAKAEGQAFGREQAAAAQGAATTSPDANRIPGFSSTPGEARYFDDPARMEREAASQANGHSGYRTMRDSMDRRARFAPQDLDAVIARSDLINTDPLAFTSGMSVGGSQGRCVPLPPGNGTAARYMATCNVGYTASEETRSCAIPLNVAVETQTRYIYWCSEFGSGDQESCTRFDDAGCERTGFIEGPCLQWGDFGGPRFCAEPGNPISVMACPAPVAGGELQNITATQTVIANRDESRCATLAADASCRETGEACTDSDPVTRVIDGVAVTQPCWAWERQYACAQYVEAQDCQTLETTPGCNLVGEECLSGEPCRTWERVYSCPVPDQPGTRARRTNPGQRPHRGQPYLADRAAAAQPIRNELWRASRMIIVFMGKDETVDICQIWHIALKEEVERAGKFPRSRLPAYVDDDSFFYAVARRS